jgi:hypothetical protein
MAGIYIGDAVHATKVQTEVVKAMASEAALRRAYQSPEYLEWQELVDLLATATDVLERARVHANIHGLKILEPSGVQEAR